MNRRRAFFLKALILSGTIFFPLAPAACGVLSYDFGSGKSDGLSFEAAEGVTAAEVEIEGKKGVMFTPPEGGTVEVTFLLAGPGTPDPGPWAVEIEYYDRADSVRIGTLRRIEGRGDRWAFTVPGGAADTVSADIWVAGRPWETGEPYRGAQWREHALFLPAAAPGNGDGPALRLSVSPAGSRCILRRVALHRVDDGFAGGWSAFEASLEESFFRQTGLVIDRVRAEESARQALRASLYAAEKGRPATEEGNASIEAALERLVPLFRRLETLHDRLYYRGRAALARGESGEPGRLLAEIEAARAEAGRLVGELERESNSLLDRLRDAAGAPASREILFQPRPEAENIPAYFRERIRLLAFSNSPWTRELWPRRARDDSGWYRLLPFYGIEAMFRIIGYTADQPLPAPRAGGFDCVIEERLDEMETAPDPDAPWERTLKHADAQYRIYSRHGLKSVPATLHLHHFYILGGLPRWFRQRHEGEEYLDRDWQGRVNDSGQGSGTVNIWHPGIRNYAREYAAAVGRQAAANPDIVAFSTFNEPRFSIGGPRTAPGYNSYAADAFRESLRGRFGTIEALNESWSAAYGSFTDIEPPPPTEEKPWQLTPLYHEWATFKRESVAEYGRMVAGAFREACPGKPVWTEGMMSRAGDIGHSHVRPLAFCNISNYSLRRVHGQTIVDAETGGGHAWEGEREVPAEVARAALERNLMDAMLWGQRGFTFWTRYFTANASGYYAAFHDNPGGSRVIATRDCSSLAVIRDKADRFGDLLANTEVAGSGVGLVNAGGAMAGAGLGSNSYRILSGRLYEANYPPFVVNADDIAAGRENLDQYRFLVMLLSPVVQPGLNEQLARWVKDGGVLFTEGPWGVINPYGAAEGELFREAFGELEIAFPPDEEQERALAARRMHRVVPEEYRHIYPRRSIGEWFLRVEPVSPAPGAEVVMADGTGAPLIMQAPLGKGRVIFSTVPVYGLADYIISRIAETVAPRAHADERLYAVAREDGAGNLFLGVVNPDSAQRVDTLITLDGVFRQVTDLGIPGGFPAALLPGPGNTRFRLTLAPGEGTIFALER